MSKPLVLVAMPVAAVRLCVPGSTVGHCLCCGCEVWLSPSSESLGYDHVLCVGCIPADELQSMGQPAAEVTN